MKRRRTNSVVTVPIAVDSIAGKFIVGDRDPDGYGVIEDVRDGGGRLKIQWRFFGRSGDLPGGESWAHPDDLFTGARPYRVVDKKPTKRGTST